MASAWLDETFMLGAEHTSRSKQGHYQFHPLTIHWRMPDGQIGWVKLVHSQPVDVVAGERELTLAGRGEMMFQVFSPGAVQEDILCESWGLNGLTVRLEGSHGPCVVAADEQDSELLTITYPALETQEVNFHLRVS